MEIKKIKKNKKKSAEKLSKDLFIIQKQIVENENESQLLDKKKERAKLDENIIKEKGNQVFSQIEEQTQRNIQNKKENDLQIQYYETVIKQKSMFIQFTDDRKERQKKIEQQAKNDNQDKQEVEKRRIGEKNIDMESPNLLSNEIFLSFFFCLSLIDVSITFIF